MASDSAATLGAGNVYTIGQQSLRKVFKLNDHVLYSATGAVGMSQLVADKIKNVWSKSDFSQATPDGVMNHIGCEIVNTVGPFLQSAGWTRALVGESNSSLCKTLVALPVQNEPQLFSFDFNGSPERATLDVPFMAMGSGQPIADPFLAFLKRLVWNTTEPTVAEGKLVAVWTLDHVRRTNPGGVGGGIQLGVIQRTDGALPVVEMLSELDIGEHEQRVQSAEASLIAELKGTANPTLFTAPPADLPTPPAKA
jgi:20S proteasome alpha/beta subunit